MSIPNYKFQGTKDGIQISVVDDIHDSFLHQGHEDDDDEEELIRVVLRRNPLGLSAAAACYDGKVRKTLSMRADDEDEKQSCSSSGIEKALRRAFSMRASSASSYANEVYRTIDHQYYDPVPPVADEENTIMAAQTEIESDHKKRNKFLEACRRFFGF